jgi:hypothetical protein
MGHACTDNFDQTSAVLTCILVVPGSNIGWDTVLAEIFRGFSRFFQDNTRKLKLRHEPFLSYSVQFSINYHHNYASDWRRLLRHQLMTYTIKSSPPKLLDFIFNKLLVFMRQWEKGKYCSLSGRSPAPIADSFYFATMARKQRVKFTRN